MHEAGGSTTTSAVPGVTDDKPLSRIPAMWEPLADLRRRVFQVFGLEGDNLERYVIDRLRNGPSYLRITDGSVRMIDPRHGGDSPRVDQGPDARHAARVRRAARAMRRPATRPA